MALTFPKPLLVLEPSVTPAPLSRTGLSALCREAGADDVAFVELERDTLAEQRPAVLRAVPWSKSFIVLPLLFQRGRSQGLAARYHFVFRGKESTQATVDIRDQRIVAEFDSKARRDC